MQVRPLPAALTEVVAHARLGDAGQGVIEGVDGPSQHPPVVLQMDGLCGILEYNDQAVFTLYRMGLSNVPRKSSPNLGGGEVRIQDRHGR